MQDTSAPVPKCTGAKLSIQSPWVPVHLNFKPGFGNNTDIHTYTKSLIKGLTNSNQYIKHDKIIKKSIYVLVQHSDNEFQLGYGVGLLFSKECPVMSALPKIISL